MKTMRRTSTLGLALGALVTALAAITLTAVTHAGAGGAYAFLLSGVTAYMIFLMWPERSRFRRRAFNSDSQRTQSGRRPR